MSAVLNSRGSFSVSLNRATTSLLLNPWVRRNHTIACATLDVSEAGCGETRARMP